MPGFRPAVKVKAVKPVRSASGPASEIHKKYWGNQYAKHGGPKQQPLPDATGRAKLARDLRAARKTATDKEDRQSFAKHARMLKDHREGKRGSITKDHADVIRNRLARIGAKSRHAAKPTPKPAVSVGKTRPGDKLTPKERDHLHSRDEITPAEYAKLHGITHSQASDHLRKLFEKGVVTGGSTGGSYRLKKNTPPKPKEAEQKPDHSKPKPTGPKITVGATPKPSRVGGSDKGDSAKPHPKPDTEVDPEYDDAHYIDVNAIHADPHRFQYKQGHTESGSVGSLQGVEKFDKHLAGVVQVWHDPADGKTYVVNGHNRLDLAKKLGAKKILTRRLDVADAKTARSIGALTNIAEGRGTAVDAAKYFKDTELTPEDVKARGIPLREKIATDGIALSRLDKPIFDKVVHGDLTQEQGVIIGEKNLTAAQQEGLVKILDKAGKGKNSITNNHLREMADKTKSVPTVKQKTHSLFGDDEEETSLVLHTTKLESRIKEMLSSEKKLFGLVSKTKNADKLTEAGNTINAENSHEVSQQAAQALDLFDRLKNLKGPVSREINAAAERIHHGDNAATVTKQTYKKILEHLPKLIESGNAFA